LTIRVEILLEQTGVHQNLGNEKRWREQKRRREEVL
jgi:hypothetical protein